MARLLKRVKTKYKRWMAKTKETKSKDAQPAFLQEDAGQFLFDALARLKTGAEVRRFMTDLCTPKELAEFSERLLIARLLTQGGFSYRDISALTGASTTTIGRVARFLEQEPHRGYKLVLGQKKEQKKEKARRTAEK